MELIMRQNKNLILKETGANFKMLFSFLCLISLAVILWTYISECKPHTLYKVAI